MTIDDLIENFELFDDWDDRYAYLMELGSKMPELPEAERIEANRVKGCQASVWLKESIQPGPPRRIDFLADSNSQIVKGLIAMLRLLYSGKTPEEILAVDAKSVFQQLGLDRHLSPTRSTGLNSMVKRIRTLATESNG
tara:strand:- start:191 stop:604 length:414 start_codon:yes stop_codon:yes gene_type:complete